MNITQYAMYKKMFGGGGGATPEEPAQVARVTCTFSNDTLPENAFKNNGHITSVILGKNIKEIGDSCFYGCYSLTEVNAIDSKVESIIKSAFSNCSKIHTLLLPKTLKNIGSSLLSNTTITSVYFGGSVEDWASIVFGESNANESNVNSQLLRNASLYINDEVLTEANISGISAIQNHVFKYYSKLTKLSVGNGVSTIGEYSFKYCKALESVVIGDDITNIGQQAFRGCSALKNVEIGSGVTDIGTWAFYQSSAIQNFIIRATTPPTLGDQALSLTSPSARIYVPAESVETYKTATNWSEYAIRIQAIA